MTTPVTKRFDSIMLSEYKAGIIKYPKLTPTRNSSYSDNSPNCYDYCDFLSASSNRLECETFIKIPKNTLIHMIGYRIPIAFNGVTIKFVLYDSITNEYVNDTLHTVIGTTSPIQSYVPPSAFYFCKPTSITKDYELMIVASGVPSSDAAISCTVIMGYQ